MRKTRQITSIDWERLKAKVSLIGTGKVSNPQAVQIAMMYATARKQYKQIMAFAHAKHVAETTGMVFFDSKQLL